MIMISMISINPVVISSELLPESSSADNFCADVRAGYIAWLLCVYGVDWVARAMRRVGQNLTYALSMTVCLVIPLPKIPYIHRVYNYGIYIGL
jgi:hypothetical protein